jgi:hypothetical protein
MVVNFRACEISQGARKLVRTSTLIKKKKERKKEGDKPKNLKAQAFIVYSTDVCGYLF